MPPDADGRIELSSAMNPIRNSSDAGTPPPPALSTPSGGGDGPSQDPATDEDSGDDPSQTLATGDGSTAGSANVEITQPSAVAEAATAPPSDTMLHHDEDNASHSSSSVDGVTRRKNRRKTRGGKGAEGMDDGTAPEEVASPVTVASPVMVDESSERTTLEVDDDGARSDRQLSLGAAAMSLGALARLRAGVRRGHATLAKRLGMALAVCSVVHDVTLIVVQINEQGELYAKMTLALSISAFVLQIALALAHDSMRVQCAAHFGFIVIEAFIRAAFHLARREFGLAAYFFVGWGLVLYPLAGWCLLRLLRVAHKLDRATKELLSSSTVTAFASSAMPILFFFGNGVLCVAFEGETHCDVRSAVNKVAILAILGNAILFILLTMRPVSLMQVVHLDIPAVQLVAFGFHGVLLGLALVLHSQNENFGPATPAIECMEKASDPCLIFLMIAFVGNVTRSGRAAAENIEEGGGADHRTPAAATTAITPAAAVGETQQYGAMVPHRIGMAGFTVLYLTLAAAPVGHMIRLPFAPLSAAAVLFHIWMRAEDTSVCWSVKLHCIAHASSAVILGIRALCNDDAGTALTMLLFLIVLYPGLYKAVTRFRFSVKSHGNASAAKLAAVSFVTFWSAVVPVMLYLGADSFGKLPILTLL